jgi:hypothetical protein
VDNQATLGRSWRRNRTSWEEEARALYAAPTVERATVLKSLLIYIGLGATKHHRNVAGAGATVGIVAKGVLPKKQVARDRTSESKAKVFGTGEVAGNAFGLIPMNQGGGAHMAAKVADDRGYICPSGREHAVCTIKDFADELFEFAELLYVALSRSN